MPQQQRRGMRSVTSGMNSKAASIALLDSQCAELRDKMEGFKFSIQTAIAGNDARAHLKASAAFADCEDEYKQACIKRKTRRDDIQFGMAVQMAAKRRQMEENLAELASQQAAAICKEY